MKFVVDTKKGEGREVDGVLMVRRFRVFWGLSREEGKLERIWGMKFGLGKNWGNFISPRQTGAVFHSIVTKTPRPRLLDATPFPALNHRRPSGTTTVTNSMARLQYFVHLMGAIGAELGGLGGGIEGQDWVKTQRFCTSSQSSHLLLIMALLWILQIFG